VHGLGDSEKNPLLHIAPGETEHVSFKADNPGLYCYWGTVDADDLKLRNGIDAELTDAFVVDPPGQVSDDEIFVMEMISEVPGLGARQTLATINGKSWPYTQRLQYNIGQEAHWRWINATNEPHALHLHGSYYRIDAINRDGHLNRYSGDSRPLVFTQRITQGESFDMSWSPERAGKWLFHCHMLQHMTPPIVPKLPGLFLKPENVPHAVHTDMLNGMGQLVLGITVTGDSPTHSTTAWHAKRSLQLEISDRPGSPRYALVLRDRSRPDPKPVTPGLIGPPIVLTRGEPVEIEVVNRLRDPTAIHWHGMELESYYDGVPGWSGTARQVTPKIDPGGSFVARMTPPRAGTFIYHTHWHDSSQLTNGIYGPLIVLPPDKEFDPVSDLTFVFSIGDFGPLHEMALINGTPQNKTLPLQTGKKYRFRLINISTSNQGMQVSLRNMNGPVEWLNLAKDGIDLPPRLTKAQQTISVGETYDVEFSTDVSQDLLLELLLPGQKIHITQTLAFLPPSAQP
jgi:FtsP/CotA-like multicopper oxidase with cupredoxin domain